MKAFGDTTNPTETPTDTAEETTREAIFTISNSPNSLTPDSINDESTPAVKLPAPTKDLEPGRGRAGETRRTAEDMSEREPSLQRAIKEYVGRQLQHGNNDWRKHLLCPFSCEGQTNIKAHASTDGWELWCERYGLCIDPCNKKTGEVVCYGHCNGLLGLVAHCKENSKKKKQQGPGTEEDDKSEEGDENAARHALAHKAATEVEGEVITPEERKQMDEQYEFWKDKRGQRARGAGGRRGRNFSRGTGNRDSRHNIAIQNERQERQQMGGVDETRGGNRPTPREGSGNQGGRDNEGGPNYPQSNQGFQGGRNDIWQRPPYGQPPRSPPQRPGYQPRQ